MTFPSQASQESPTTAGGNQRVPKPKWLRVKLPTGEPYKKVREIVSEHKLHTIVKADIVRIWESVGGLEPLLS